VHPARSRTAKRVRGGKEGTNGTGSTRWDAPKGAGLNGCYLDGPGVGGADPAGHKT
jgi:hypothetical protein